jgi:hypothetical protein
MEIATGRPEEHPTPLPLQDSGPGITPLAGLPVTSGSGTEQGGVRDTAGERLSALAAAEADVRAAQAAGMSAEHDRRAHYAADILPIGAAYGDTMTLDGGSLDPGAGGGVTLPAGFFYDPPRLGAPETYVAAGNEPQGTMPG